MNFSGMILPKQCPGTNSFDFQSARSGHEPHEPVPKPATGDPAGVVRRADSWGLPEQLWIYPPDSTSDGDVDASFIDFIGKKHVILMIHQADWATLLLKHTCIGHNIGWLSNKNQHIHGNSKQHLAINLTLK